MGRGDNEKNIASPFYFLSLFTCDRRTPGADGETVTPECTTRKRPNARRQTRAPKGWRSILISCVITATWVDIETTKQNARQTNGFIWISATFPPSGCRRAKQSEIAVVSSTSGNHRDENLCFTPIIFYDNIICKACRLLYGRYDFSRRHINRVGNTGLARNLSKQIKTCSSFWRLFASKENKHKFYPPTC